MDAFAHILDVLFGLSAKDAHDLTLVPVTPLRAYPPKRDGRVKPGHDN
jgi:hypothetical protein